MIDAFLHGLEMGFTWLVEASWQASVLVALVLLFQVMLQGRLNPRWHHALWLLVMARLILPALPKSSFSVFQFTPHPSSAIAEAVTAPIFAPPPQLLGAIQSLPAPAAMYPFSVFTILALVWLLGALGLLILTWRVNRRFALHVAATPSVTDSRLTELAAVAQRELGLHRQLRIIESAQAQSPAIMGLFRPTLILPREVRERFTDGELRLIFLHEFAHLKRGDLLVQWIVALLQILHWFNPILWYAFRRMRIDREPATDALVLSRTGEDQKECYGQVLVKLLEHYHQRHSLPTLVGILEDKDQFKRRFSLITRFTRGAYAWSFLGVLLIVVLATLCLTERKAPATETSKPKLENPEVLLYIRFDKIGNTFGFGKLSLIASISDGTKIPSTGETLSVWCKSLTAKNAVLEFIASKPSGPPQKGPDGSSMQPTSERRAQQIVPLGKTFSFRILNAVDVTTSPTINPDNGQIHSPEADGRATPDSTSSQNSINPASAGLPPVPIPSPTPLEKALTRRDTAAIKMLLDQGARVYMPDVYHALSTGQKEAMKLLWDHGGKYCSELAYAISQNRPMVEIEKISLQKPSSNPWQQDVMITPLGIAAQEGNKELVAWLLDHGADPHPFSTLQNPLLPAVQGRHPEIVDYLLKHGAYAGDLVLFTAICWCNQPDPQLHQGSIATVKSLIQAGVLKNETSGMAGQALMTVCEKRNSEVLKLLLDSGMSPRLPNNYPPAPNKPVIDVIREEYAQRVTKPEYADLKPLLDLLEAADKSASNT